MNGRLESIREITISDEMLFPDAESLTGTIERQSAGGGSFFGRLGMERSSSTVQLIPMGLRCKASIYA